jgi:hypothetical protein
MSAERQSVGFTKSTELRAEQATSPDKPYCIAAYSLAADANYVVLRHSADGARPLVFEQRESAQRRLSEVARNVPSAFVFGR